MKLIFLILFFLFDGVTEKWPQKYFVIESDYDGTILLDAETGARYLRTDTGLYELEEG
nr:hypothetical protein [uncultured Marvinbryantia sp.]